MRRIVSVPVHTSELGAVDLCLNYLSVGEVDGIVIHVNALSAFQVARFEQVVLQLAPLRGRVWVNPQRVAIPQMRSAPHHVAVLHRAHVSNFAFADAALDFDIFCLDASNSLLVLPGLKDHVTLARTGALGPHRWRHFFWHRNSLPDPIWTLLGDDWWQCNPEGSFYSRGAFAHIAAKVATYEARLSEAGAPDGAPICDFPREEYLFPSLYAQIRGAQDLVLPYIFMRWATGLCWHPHEIREILDSGQILDGHLPRYGQFGIKRVGLHPSDWLRQMVGEHYGYRRWTDEAICLWGG